MKIGVLNIESLETLILFGQLEMEIRFIYSNALLSKIQMTRNRETYPNSTSYIEIANSLGTDKIQMGLRVHK